MSIVFYHDAFIFSPNVAVCPVSAITQTKKMQYAFPILHTQTEAACPH
ncbi:hypothetical protein [Bartonella massiliensis]|nr:hypothetical protein [Bartonella massiliensis]